ncbi:Ser/threonine protein phosphatase [Hyphomicrobiales bacterium]|jgi:serine/threonine protein phosphatase 1|nr:Ser/threonine protein phosphatase [Hyphomicrobiales bacterium]CAH1702833.1 Metallophos domain-containing protein [Hyphomicrobiales bacterium]CAI0347021.1 Ser/threonine protein phosphatase [Hyphomicrobiales bacterium]
MIQTADLRLPFACADEHELFLIGDVHGCAEQLEELLDRAASTPKVADRRRVFISVGDVIDRGPASLRALDLVISAKERIAADEEAHLMGNHEQLLKIALIGGDGPASANALRVWARNGGRTVMNELLALHLEDHDLTLARGLGPARLAHLNRLVSHFRSGKVLAVHGGISPYAPLDGFLAAPWAIDPAGFKEEHHWAWIREPFLDFVPSEGKGHHGYFVVHGHSQPYTDPSSIWEQVRRYRLNLDGGSYKSGVVRMARIVGHDCELMLTDPT